MSKEERWAGTVKFSWSISEKDLGLPSDRVATPKELRAVCDRLEDLMNGAFGADFYDVSLDGSGKDCVRVHVDMGGLEIEVDDGQVNGTLDEIREDAQEDA